jgi:hypothetical protein
MYASGDRLALPVKHEIVRGISWIFDHWTAVASLSLDRDRKVYHERGQPFFSVTRLLNDGGWGSEDGRHSI